MSCGNNFDMNVDYCSFVPNNDHSKLKNRDLKDQHPIESIEGLKKILDALSPTLFYESLRVVADAIVTNFYDTEEEVKANLGKALNEMQQKVDTIFIPDGVYNLGDETIKMQSNKTLVFGKNAIVNYTATDNDYKLFDISADKGITSVTIVGGQFVNSSKSNLGTAFYMHNSYSCKILDVLINKANIGVEISDEGLGTGYNIVKDAIIVSVNTGVLFAAIFEDSDSDIVSGTLTNNIIDNVEIYSNAVAVKVADLPYDYYVKNNYARNLTLYCETGFEIGNGTLPLYIEGCNFYITGDYFYKEESAYTSSIVNGFANCIEITYNTSSPLLPVDAFSNNVKILDIKSFVGDGTIAGDKYSKIDNIYTNYIVNGREILPPWNRSGKDDTKIPLFKIIKEAGEGEAVSYLGDKTGFEVYDSRGESVTSYVQEYISNQSESSEQVVSLESIFNILNGAVTIRKSGIDSMGRHTDFYLELTCDLLLNKHDASGNRIGFYYSTQNGKPVYKYLEGNEYNLYYDNNTVITDSYILKGNIVGSKNDFGTLKVGDNINVSNGVISISAASGSNLGLVKIGDGINLENGLISVDEYVLPEATDIDLGGIKIGYKENNKNYAVKIDGNSKAYVTVPWYDTKYDSATTETYGLVKVGKNINVLSGVISVSDASNSTAGLVKVGDNIDVYDGTISIPQAKTNSFGVVKIGNNINSIDGVITVKTATDSIIGGVKSGGDILIDSNGLLEVQSLSDTNIIDIFNSVWAS